MLVLGPGRFSKGSAAVFRFISTYLEVQISILNPLFDANTFIFVFLNFARIFYIFKALSKLPD